MTIHLQVFTLLVVFDINSKPCNIDLYYKSFNFIEGGNFKALWDLLTFLYPYYIYRHILPKLKRKIKYIKMWDITRTWTWHKDSLEKKHRLSNYTSVFDLQCNIHLRCFSTIAINDFIYKLDRFEISRQVACAWIKLLLGFFLFKPLYLLIEDRFLFLNEITTYVYKEFILSLILASLFVYVKWKF